ncbi:hypothetical protein, partial [Staphylococcus aureus]
SDKNIIIDSPNEVTSSADDTSETHHVNTAAASLNGDSNLETPTQQSKVALLQMTLLDDAKKQSITGQIYSAPKVTGVQSV